jgi:hypothetical protein
VYKTKGVQGRIPETLQLIRPKINILRKNLTLTNFQMREFILCLTEYWSHFKVKKLNKILDTARTYGFQFRNN